jgi:hypothetical protein
VRKEGQRAREIVEARSKNMWEIVERPGLDHLSRGARRCVNAPKGGQISAGDILSPIIKDPVG